MKTIVVSITAVLCLVALTAQAANLTPADYAEIEQLYATYNHAIDTGDGDTWAGTFTADGTFNTFTGREQLVGFIKQWREKMNGGNRRHWNTNLKVVGTADGANGSVYLMLVDVGTRPPAVISTGMYTDSLVKTAQGWRFKKRLVKIDAPAAAAPAAVPPQSAPATPRPE
jgi:hypothetical protein